MIREAYFESAEEFARVVDQIDIDSWDDPGLGEWTLRDLAGHTYRALTTILGYSEKLGDTVDIESPLDYFATVLEGYANPKMVAERGRAAGLEIMDNPQMMVRGFLNFVRTKMEDIKDEDILKTPVGGMRLIDYLPTRVFELTIHTMDLAKAAGVESEPSPKGMEITLEILAGIAFKRGFGPSLAFGLTGRNDLPIGFSLLNKSS